MQFTLVDEGDGQRAISIVHDGDVKVALGSHPAFQQILAGALENDLSILDLFDASQYVAKQFEDQLLGDRVSARNGRIYLDGDELHNSLSEKIVEFLGGGENWYPLVRFLEKVVTNPNDHSREQLFTYLERHKFALTLDGDIVTYKGVSDGYYSSHGGHAIVDGVEVNGKVLNEVGSIIEMPRSEVQHDPSNGCSVGLHAATFNFAENWSSKTLRLIVNPRDVVSVPLGETEKMRVCRYYVDAEVAEEDGDLILGSDFVFDGEDDCVCCAEEPSDPVFSSEPIRSPVFA